MLRIHQAVQAGGFPNATRLAAELEVSTKSVHRDIEFMRDRLGLPLEYDPRRAGYYYTETVSSFPALQITEGELLALLVAEKALQQYRGTSFEEPLVSALQKLSRFLPDTVSLHLAEWEDTISFRTVSEPRLDLQLFDQIARATAGREQLVLTYRKPGQRDSEERIVDPYHLANINGEWFLFGFCHLRQDIRTFAPARIQDLRLSGKKFERPERFSLEQRLQDSFGVHTGNRMFDIRIQFDEFAADYVREKRWHSSQELREIPGGIEVRLRLSSLVEVQRWILGWGGHAIVIAPAELRDTIERAAGRILQAQKEAKPNTRDG